MKLKLSSITKAGKQIINNQRLVAQQTKYNSFQSIYDFELTFSEAFIRYPDINSLYAYMHHYFVHRSPAFLREHRSYFALDHRGFGEDAFHAMWWLLQKEYKPRECLEIGVYRGQVISLLAYIGKVLSTPCHLSGISPFSPLGDTVSKYLKTIDYEEDVISHFKHFNLPLPRLLRALSTDPKAIEYIRSKKWDIIYIDGSHDLDVITQDFEICQRNLSDQGFIVLDDASLGLDYQPPLFAFAGHPGPSRVAREIACKEMTFIGAVGHMNIFKAKPSQVLNP